MSDWRPFEPSRETERAASRARLVHSALCVCHGAGWLWGFEFPGGEDPPTDTRYRCVYETDEDEP